MASKPSSPFSRLTWTGIRAWAGPVIAERGKNYQRTGRVHALRLLGDKTLLASVRGNELYAVRVDVIKGRVASECSCPYEENCKHAVAAVLEYWKTEEAGREIPKASSRDPGIPLAREENRVVPPSGPRADRTLHQHLRSLSREELEKQLLELATARPEIHDTLHHQAAIRGKSVRELATEARRALTRAASKRPWWDSWNRRGSLPDYEPVRQLFLALLQAGGHGTVLELGRTLLKKGIHQIETSDDEGMTAHDIASVFGVVGKALEDAPLPDAEKLNYAFDLAAADDYHLTDDVARLREKPYPRAVWAAHALHVRKRLGALPPLASGNDGWSAGRHERAFMAERLLEALRHAGEEEEALRLARREAARCRHPEWEADQLARMDRDDEAEAALLRALSGQALVDFPGIRDRLMDRLEALGAKRGDRKRVAALRAVRFFRVPERKPYDALARHAAKAGKAIGHAVAARARQYLLDGALPRTGEGTPPWPLSLTGLEERPPHLWEGFPRYSVLAELALQGKQPREVARWYDAAEAASRLPHFGERLLDRCAKSMERDFPEKSLAIWKAFGEAKVATADVKRYAEACAYFAKVRALLLRRRHTREWREYAQSVRERHKAKRRFMEEFALVERG